MKLTSARSLLGLLALAATAATAAGCYAAVPARRVYYAPAGGYYYAPQPYYAHPYYAPARPAGVVIVR
jgi:hypothetical protein